jgi:hypothetical protein
MCLLFLARVGWAELEEQTVSILNFVTLALLLQLSGGLERSLGAVFFQVFVLENFSANESVLHITVDCSSGLRCRCVSAKDPGANLISSGGEKLDKVQGTEASLGNLVNVGLSSIFLAILGSILVLVNKAPQPPSREEQPQAFRRKGSSLHQAHWFQSTS